MSERLCKLKWRSVVSHVLFWQGLPGETGKAGKPGEPVSTCGFTLRSQTYYTLETCALNFIVMKIIKH